MGAVSESAQSIRQNLHEPTLVYSNIEKPE